MVYHSQQQQLLEHQHFHSFPPNLLPLRLRNGCWVTCVCALGCVTGGEPQAESTALHNRQQDRLAATPERDGASVTLIPTRLS